MICKECQQFLGAHSHNVPYHQTLCACDGSNQSKRLFQDPDLQIEIRMQDVSDTDKERLGDYTGTIVPTVLSFSPAVKRLMKE